jgi:FtsP/CotA-like multicopper oxidase with cupredoxin domain
MDMKKLLLPMSIALALGAQNDALAQDYWLCAKPVDILLPQGGKVDGGGAPAMKNVIVWGLVEARGSTTAAKLSNFNAGCPLSGQIPQVPGPRLTVPPDDSTLTVHLKNALTTNRGGEPISLIIPGQDQPSVTGSGGTGILGVGETAPGGARDYTWNNLKPGTYAYHSASHPQLQIPMGLYGVVTHDAAPKTAYPGVAYDNEAVLVYSEIDPALYLHQNVGNAMQVPETDRYGSGSAVASSINYKPEFFLINGKPFGAGDPDDANSVLNNLFVGSPLVPGGKTLLRLVNMGLQTRVPNLLGAIGEVLAEDGHPYAYRKAQYSVTLPAGGTRDVLIETPPDPGVVPVVDRMAGLSSGDPTVTTLNPDLIAVDRSLARPESGMLAKLRFGAANPAQAVADTYTIIEGRQNYVSSPAVIANDILGDYAGHARLEAVLDSPPSQGTLVPRTYLEQAYALEPTGLFTYSHNPDSQSSDSFTYHLRVVADGKGPELAGSVLAETAPATVTIDVTPVNDQPVTVADSYLTNPALQGVAATNPYTLAVVAPGILANDTDPDLPPQTLTVDGAPRTVKTPRGQFDLQADGSFAYTPWTAATVGGSGVTGATPFTTTRADSFTYRANDGQGEANSISVTRTVTALTINTAPTRLAGSPGTTANPYAVSRSSATPSVQIRLADLFADTENNIDSASATAFTCGKAGFIAGESLTKTATDTYTYTVPANIALGDKILSCVATDVWGVSVVNTTAARRVIVRVDS